MFNFFKTKKNKEDNNLTTNNIESQESIANEKIDIGSEIDIYVMPEKFRRQNKEDGESKKLGLIIISLGIILLIGVSVAMYFILFGTNKSKQQKVVIDFEENQEENQKEKESEEVINNNIQVLPPSETPREAYLRIKKEEENAASTSPLKDDSILTSEIKNIFEEISSSSATLSIISKDEQKNGTVIMALENNIWKIVSETWTNLATTTVATSTDSIPDDKDKKSLKLGDDSDQDGLTDKEEILFGSKSDSIDSDGDGYKDLEELMNFYNPNGAGKLDAGVKIKKYSNRAFGYDFYLPADWEVNNIAGNDSLILKNQIDNQFFQIIAQSNDDKQEIDSWYKDQVKDEKIPKTRVINNDYYDGILNEEGLIIYLTDKKKNYIITIAYNTADSHTIDYSAIFKMMIKSFKIK